MVLCMKTKFDCQNRLLIPRDYLKAAGGSPNGKCYVLYDEGTNQIVIIPVKQDKENKKTEETNERI